MNRLWRRLDWLYVVAGAWVLGHLLMLWLALGGRG